MDWGKLAQDWGLVGSKGSATPVWVPEVKDFRVPITDAQGKPNYRMPNAGDRARDSGAYSVLEARKRAEVERGEALITAQEKRSDRKFEAEQTALRETLKQQGLTTQAQLTALRNEGTARQQQFELLQTGQTNQLTDAREGRTHEGVQNDANRTLQRDQLSTENQRILEQMRLNDITLNRKLTLENQQFERQAALDERTARRTKVLGMMNLIIQSLQRV